MVARSPADPSRTDLPAALGRVHLDGQTLRLGGNWPELLRLLSTEAGAAVTLALDGVTPLALDPAAPSVKLNRTAARAAQGLTSVRAVPGAGDGRERCRPSQSFCPQRSASSGETAR